MLETLTDVLRLLDLTDLGHEAFEGVQPDTPNHYIVGASTSTVGQLDSLAACEGSVSPRERAADTWSNICDRPSPCSSPRRSGRGCADRQVRDAGLQQHVLAQLFGTLDDAVAAARKHAGAGSD